MQFRYIIGFCIFYILCYPIVAAQDESRADVLITHVADEYQPPSMNIGDPEKYYWPKAIARFEKYGVTDELANSYIATFRYNSPFHFTLVGMARIMSGYPDAPAMKKHKIQYLQEVFERTDSHNPWTSEGTENHINMSRTSGYLFAQHALEFPELFPQAHLRLQQMELWIKQWAEQLYERGNAEWNSDIYEFYNMVGWLNLYDFAENRDVKNIARAVLDFYAAEIALFYSWGLPGGPAMRGGGIGNTRNTATNYLGWLWFGTSNDFPFPLKGSQYIQMVHATSSNYFPPQVLIDIGKKDMELPSWYRLGRPSYSLTKPSFIKQFFYVTNTYSLGSAVSPYGGWTGSTWQMINWRLVVRSEKTGWPFEIGGNGRFYDEWTGKSTNPFTQISQHKNVLIQMTKIPENAKSIVDSVKQKVDAWDKKWERDFKKRFPHDQHKIKHGVVNFAGKMIMENKSYISFPAEADIQQKDNFYLVRLNQVTLLVIPFQSVQEINEIIIKNQNRKVLLDEAQVNQMCGFVMEVLHEDSIPAGHVEQLKDILSDLQIDTDVGMVSYTSITGHKMNVLYKEKGWFQEATVDWGYGVETPRIMMTGADFKQPEWPSGKGYGRIPFLEVDGNVMDFEESWPLFEGESIKMKNKILDIQLSGENYKVDFSNEVPRFSK